MKKQTIEPPQPRAEEIEEAGYRQAVEQARRRYLDGYDPDATIVVRRGHAVLALDWVRYRSGLTDKDYVARNAIRAALIGASGAGEEGEKGEWSTGG